MKRLAPFATPPPSNNNLQHSVTRHDTNCGTVWTQFSIRAAREEPPKRKVCITKWILSTTTATRGLVHSLSVSVCVCVWCPTCEADEALCQTTTTWMPPILTTTTDTTSTTTRCGLILQPKRSQAKLKNWACVVGVCVCECVCAAIHLNLQKQQKWTMYTHVVVQLA